MKRKAPAMQLYVKDAVTDTGHLPSDAFKGYWLLTFKAWAGVEGQEQGYLPGDDTRLQEMSGLQPRAWRAARPRILGLFRKTEDNRYYSKRGVEEVQRLSSISEKRSQAGRDGAAARWQKPSPVNGNGIDLPMANDSSASASASAKEEEKNRNQNRVEDNPAGQGPDPSIENGTGKRHLSRQQQRVKNVEDATFKARDITPPPAKVIAKWLASVDELEIDDIVDGLESSGKLSGLSADDLPRYIFGCIKRHISEQAEREKRTAKP